MRPDPEATIAAGVPNACNRCHTERDAAWAAAQMRSWYPDDRTRALRRAATQTIAGARAGDCTPEVARGWAFLAPYLHAAKRFVFSRSTYAPPEVDPDRLVIIPPTIDPFSTKNQPMDASCALPDCR